MPLPLLFEGSLYGNIFLFERSSYYICMTVFPMPNEKIHIIVVLVHVWVATEVYSSITRVSNSFYHCISEVYIVSFVVHLSVA